MPQRRQLPPELLGNTAWEAMKASRRNLTHEAAVAECADLSNLYRRMWRRMAPVQISLEKILKALQAKKIPFVLTGAHGISGWTGRPRSTHDVDILVKSGRNFTRAVNALKALYPQLEVKPFPGVTAFFVPGENESVIDVSYPHRADMEETLRTGVWVEEGDWKYRVPALEAALANKYGAMLTPTRDAGKRAQDAVDFFQMVRHSLDEGRQPIDLESLKGLGDRVWPEGGGEELLRLVEEAKEGKVPNLELDENRHSGDRNA
jgi:hypothetical protein